MAVTVATFIIVYPTISHDNPVFNNVSAWTRKSDVSWPISPCGFKQHESMNWGQFQQIWWFFTLAKIFSPTHIEKNTEKQRSGWTNKQQTSQHGRSGIWSTPNICDPLVPRDSNWKPPSLIETSWNVGATWIFKPYLSKKGRYMMWVVLKMRVPKTISMGIPGS